MNRLTSFLLLLLPLSVVAQGTLNFQNTTTTRIRDLCGNNLPIGNPSPFAAGLYWGPEGSGPESLTLLSVTRDWRPFAGIFVGGVVTFPVPADTLVSVQVRVWPGGYATYEDAREGFDWYYAGAGVLQTLALGDAENPQLLSNPRNGGTPFSGFQIGPLTPPTGVPCIPEPGTSVLMALAGLLLAGRRFRSAARRR